MVKRRLRIRPSFLLARCRTPGNGRVLRGGRSRSMRIARYCLAGHVGFWNEAATMGPREKATQSASRVLRWSENRTVEYIGSGCLSCASALEERCRSCQRSVGPRPRRDRSCRLPIAGSDSGLNATPRKTAWPLCANRCCRPSPSTGCRTRSRNARSFGCRSQSTRRTAEVTPQNRLQGDTASLLHSAWRAPALRAPAGHRPECDT